MGDPTIDSDGSGPVQMGRWLVGIFRQASPGRNSNSQLTRICRIPESPNAR